MNAEISDSPAVKVLSPETIAKERAAAAQDLPDAPMEVPKDDGVVGHPSNSFNTMASKLEQAIKETLSSKGQKDPSTAPDDSDKRVEKRVDPKDKAEKGEKADKPVDAAKAAEQAKAEEQQRLVEEAAEKTITGAKAGDWKAIKESREQFKKAATEWEQKFSLVSKEYEEYKKKADPEREEAVKKQIAELTEKNNKLQEELKRTALEGSDDFNSFYKKQFDASVAKAKESVGAEHAELIEQILAMPPSKWRKERINEIREELTGHDQGQLDIAIHEYDKARNDREAQLKDVKTNYAKLKERDQERAAMDRAAMERRNEAALAAVLSVARDTSPSFKRGDDKEHNAFVDEAEAFATKFFKRQLNDTEMALLPVVAMEARRYSERVVPALEKKVKELEAALKEYQSGTPSPGGSGGNTRVPTTGKKGFVETFNELWPQGNR